MNSDQQAKILEEYIKLNNWEYDHLTEGDEVDFSFLSEPREKKAVIKAPLKKRAKTKKKVATKTPQIKSTTKKSIAKTTIKKVSTVKNNTPKKRWRATLSDLYSKEELREKAIKQNPDALQHIKNKTDEEIKLALSLKPTIWQRAVVIFSFFSSSTTSQRTYS